MTGVLFLFAVGVLMDVVWSRAVRAVAQKKAYLAAGYAMVLNSIAMGSTWYVVETQSGAALVAYAAGGGLGTIIGLKLWRK